MRARTYARDCCTHFNLGGSGATIVHANHVHGQVIPRPRTCPLTQGRVAPKRVSRHGGLTSEQLVGDGTFFLAVPRNQLSSLDQLCV